MLQTPPKRIFLSTLVAVSLALIVAFAAAGFDQYFKIPYLEKGDVAVNALQIDNAKYFREIYGNYSRFEFNHPGPAFFYAYAAGEWIFCDWLKVTPSPGTAHLFTSMCLQSLFFALSLAIMATHLSPRLWLPLGLLTAALYFGPLKDPFMSIWPPHVLLMPFLCFLVSCCSVGTGRVAHLPFAVLAGGFLFHGHVAQPLFVGSLGTLAFALCAYRLRGPAPHPSWREIFASHRRVAITSAALAGLFLLPIVIDVVTGGTRSNIATILGRFYANTGDSKSLWQSFLYFLSFATPAQNQDEIFSTMGPQVGEFFRTYRGHVGLWICLLALPPLLGLIWRSRLTVEERRFLLTSHLFVLCAVAGCILWGMAQAGPMWQYNGYFYYAVYFFGLLLILGWLDGLVRYQGNAAFTSVLFAVSAIAFTWAFRLPRLGESETGAVTKRAVEAALSDHDTRPKILVFEHKDWPAVASVALDLQRQGFNFYMEPWWQFMFGLRHQVTRLGDASEKSAQVWWLTNPGPGGIPLSPTLSIFTKPAPIQASGDEIRFRGGDNAFRYIVQGVNAGIVDFAWAELPRLVLVFAPQPSDRDVKITFDARSAWHSREGTKPQLAVIFYNDQEVGRLTAFDRAPLSITVPRELWNRNPAGKLELRFPDALPNHDYKRPRHEWWTSWGIWSIRFDPAS